MSYSGTGVDYDLMDPFKRLAQKAGLETAGNIARLKNGMLKEFLPSRGESAYLIEDIDCYHAHVEEGLGTKNLVADAMYKLSGKTYYNNIAQDTVAMIVNDMATVGAMPLSVAMHLAVGDSKWFVDEKRSTDLVEGWKNACHQARCIYSCGETPTLKGIVNPDTVVLAGSAMGIVEPKSNLISADNIMDGDAIVIIESSGIHANGLTLAREIAKNVMYGYQANLWDTTTFGEALLEPTIIYVGLVNDLQTQNIPIHYAVNVTGHGWRKFMRADRPFEYIIQEIPKPHAVFDFMKKYGPMDDMEAYGNLNMGAGFALYVSHKDVSSVLNTAKNLKLRAMYAGNIKASKEKSVIILPKRLEYKSKTLGVR